MNRVINLKWVVLALILVYVLPSCQKETHNEVNAPAVATNLKLSPGECDVITDLMAGQYTDVGDVVVTHDEANIYVTYYITEPGWCLEETHLHIASNLAGIPQTKSGNPKVGHFEYQSQHDCEVEYTYVVPIIWAPNFSVVIAAHAVVANNDGGANSQETAWAGDLPFPGNNWAMYFEYMICFENGGGNGQESEIAYAYAPEGSGIPSDCFLSLNISNNWGWQNGPFSNNYTFELWALPNSCDHSTGFHVGEVEVIFKGGNKVDVIYRTYLGYSLQEADLWISDMPWDLTPPVDPEDFPYHAYELNGAMVYTFSNIVHRGQMFMIAHAKVYGVIHIG